MTHFGLVVFSFVLSLVSPVPAGIEDAFRRNDADALKAFLAPGTFLSLSVSGPVAFSDILSDEQTILWFRKFFHSAKTLGFYTEPASGLNVKAGGFVFKARWEVQSEAGKTLAYDILFLIRNRSAEKKGGRPAENGFQGIWTILQIRAEER